MKGLGVGRATGARRWARARRPWWARFLAWWRGREASRRRDERLIADVREDLASRQRVLLAAHRASLQRADVARTLRIVSRRYDLIEASALHEFGRVLRATRTRPPPTGMPGDGKPRSG